MHFSNGPVGNCRTSSGGLGALLDGAANGGGFVFGAAPVSSAASADERPAQAEQFLDRGVDVGDPFVEHVTDGGTRRATTAADCEYFADVDQMQADGASTPDEGQQLDIALIVEPMARWGSIGRPEQALGLIDSQRFAGEPGSRSGLPDRQSG
jgi:hypothetical protein